MEDGVAKAVVPTQAAMGMAGITGVMSMSVPMSVPAATFTVTVRQPHAGHGEESGKTDQEKDFENAHVG